MGGVGDGANWFVLQNHPEIARIFTSWAVLCRSHGATFKCSRGSSPEDLDLSISKDTKQGSAASHDKVHYNSFCVIKMRIRSFSAVPIHRNWEIRIL